MKAIDFRNALENFLDAMKGTMADFEIVSITETAIMDVFHVEAEEEWNWKTCWKTAIGWKKYDDLKNAVERLKEVQADNGAPYESASYPYQLWLYARNGQRSRTTFTMQPFMLQLFIDTLESEIKKMEEEWYPS